MSLKNLQIYDSLRSAMLPLLQIDEALPKNGKITELGCGQGVIAKYLAEKKTRQLIGIDSDKKRIGKSKSKNLHFIAGDITRLALKNQDAFVISDVLHHIDSKKQKELLLKISNKLNKNGVLVVKEIDKAELVRSNLSRFWDLVLYPHDAINYWKAKDLKKFLSGLGFKVTVKRPCRLFPGSTTLFICNKA